MHPSEMRAHLANCRSLNSDRMRVPPTGQYQNDNTDVIVEIIINSDFSNNMQYCNAYKMLLKLMHIASFFKKNDIGQICVLCLTFILFYVGSIILVCHILILKINFWLKKNTLQSAYKISIVQKIHSLFICVFE